MPKCRDCRWARQTMGGDPTQGVCLYGSKEASEEETASGVQVAYRPGKVIDLRAEACEYFEPKGSRQQMLKEGL
jgi:hypothetical protein